MQSGSELNAEFRAVKRIPIRDYDVDAFAFLIRVVAGGGREGDRDKSHSRYVPCIEIAGKFAALYPGRANNFKRRICPPATEMLVYSTRPTPG